MPLINIDINVLLDCSRFTFCYCVICFLLVPPPPKNVEVVSPDGSDHGYVYVKWNKPECVTNLACGYAEEFILVYCLVSSGDNEACVGRLFYDCEA